MILCDATIVGRPMPTAVRFTFMPKVAVFTVPHPRAVHAVCCLLAASTISVMWAKLPNISCPSSEYQWMHHFSPASIPYPCEGLATFDPTTLAGP